MNAQVRRERKGLRRVDEEDDRGVCGQCWDSLRVCDVWRCRCRSVYVPSNDSRLSLSLRSCWNIVIPLVISPFFFNIPCCLSRTVSLSFSLSLLHFLSFIRPPCGTGGSTQEERQWSIGGGDRERKRMLKSSWKSTKRFLNAWLTPLSLSFPLTHLRIPESRNHKTLIF